ncbi:MAG TPA: hypothetical protein VG269_25245 [Tepidisphaeraceae bacterium]|jgi:hypothetical protein|nr:hypothetical protein [Tepidisphaeraceae bacterium]
MPKDKASRPKPKPATNPAKDAGNQPGESAHEPPDDVTQAVESGDPEITGRQSGQPGETMERKNSVDRSGDI